MVELASHPSEVPINVLHGLHSSNGGVDPLDPFLDPGLPFLLPLLDLSLLPPRLRLWCDPEEMVDSAGLLSFDSWERLSRRAAVSPSVKLERNVSEHYHAIVFMLRLTITYLRQSRPLIQDVKLLVSTKQ